MKPLLAHTLAAAAAGVCSAGQPDAAILAAMQLSEQPNYTWTTVVNDDAQVYNIEGKADRQGWTWVRLPMVKAIAQRLGRDADTQIEAVFRGNDACVIRTQDGWKQIAELPRRHRDWNDDDMVIVVPRGAPAALSMAGGPALDPTDPFAVDPFPTIVRVPTRRDAGSAAYSNAQFALSLPHDELAIVISSCTQLNVTGDIVEGVLSDVGAQLLLVRDGQEQIQALAGAGVFKLHVQGGLVTRYQLRLEGVLVVDRKRLLVHQTSDTQIRNIGTTRVALTEEIRRKLGD